MNKRASEKLPAGARDGSLDLPVIASGITVLLPGETATLKLVRKPEIKRAETLAAAGDPLAIVCRPQTVGRGATDIGKMVVIGRILLVDKGLQGNSLAVIRAEERARVVRVVRRRPVLMIQVERLAENGSPKKSSGRLLKGLGEAVEQLAREFPPEFQAEISALADYRSDPGLYVDRLAALLHPAPDEKQRLVEAAEISFRVEIVKELIERKLRERTLIRRFSAVCHEAGQADVVCSDSLIEFGERISRDRSLPVEVRKRCLIEIDRLGHLSPVSAEYGTTRLYLDWLLSVPWQTDDSPAIDLKRVEREIDRTYYGPTYIKRRIIERVAINKLTAGRHEGPVLCLAGVPGTGKASLARAIASALGREFIRLTVGGMTEIADIKGVARNYPGAMPGKIIRTLRDAGTSDPIIYIEDIEYFAEENNTALVMSLLEAIDPRYNHRFLDNYIGFPVDLSRVKFICGTRSVEDISDILSHRLEIVELPGYIEKEKIHIARKYLIPAVLKKHGLRVRDIRFTVGGLKKIIRNYTLEAGLLNFRRRLERICRHVAIEKASSSRRVWTVSEKTVESFLGSPRYIPEMPEKSPEVGVAVGLAWTGLGGDLMIIEGIKMKGSGEVITTGSLGEVMKESITAAHSYVRSKADVLGIDHGDFENFDVHIHFPSGAIPKDGPSAGVAVSLVIASVMAERPIPNNIAMTGEVTLRGRVLQVGGIIEKISAAYRAGIRKVFIPEENKKDLKDLPSDILSKTKFIFIETVDEIFAQGLLDFVPSSYTLEKIFADELEKAKNRKKNSPSRKKIVARGTLKK